MKNKLIIDGKEYIVDLDLFRKLFSQVEKQEEPVEEDKYKKIREVVERYRDELYIKGDTKELYCQDDGTLELRRYKNPQCVLHELHFEECTLGDLEENDVFVFNNTVYISADKGTSESTVYYLNKYDIIRTTFLSNENPVIKILRN